MDNSTKSFACSTEVSSFCVSFFKVTVITLDLYIILFIASQKYSAMESSVLLCLLIKFKLEEHDLYNICASRADIKCKTAV